MNVSSILFIIVIIILLYFLVRYIYASKQIKTGVSSGTATTTISASDLEGNTSGTTSSNFTYSIWFYIEDWNYRYGEPKVLFERTTSSNPVTSSGDLTQQISTLEPCPAVALGEISNDINILLSVYPSTGNAASTDGSNYVTQICSVSNVPIQKWVNLLISVYGRSLDVYLDGKLVKTFVLQGVAYINSGSDLYITPNGGFNGWTSNFQYMANATDPQTAWNIYKNGYGGTGIGSYQVKLSLVKDGSETRSITL
jgi:hypothetical protein